MFLKFLKKGTTFKKYEKLNPRRFSFFFENPAYFSFKFDKIVNFVNLWYIFVHLFILCMICALDGVFMHFCLNLYVVVRFVHWMDE